jgi:hypothetical protein
MWCIILFNQIPFPSINNRPGITAKTQTCTFLIDCGVLWEPNPTFWFWHCFFLKNSWEWGAQLCRPQAGLLIPVMLFNSQGQHLWWARASHQVLVLLDGREREQNPVKQTLFIVEHLHSWGSESCSDVLLSSVSNLLLVKWASIPLCYVSVTQP